jgi:hypothetical protein
MKKLALERLLHTYAGFVDQGGARPDDFQDLTPEARAELESFARLVAQLQGNLTPLRPRDAFIEDLGRSLLAAAVRRQSWRASSLDQLRRHWKLTAVTASGVSVAAVSAVSAAIWYRGRNNTQ